MKELHINGSAGTYTFQSQQQNRIHIGIRNSDQLSVCLKKIKHNNKAYLRSFEKFSSLDHPSIAKSLELIEEDNEMYVIREYYSGTNLKTIIETRSLYHKVSELFFIKLTIALLKAVDVLHQAQILHLDLKPANIIIRHKEGELPSQWNPENILLIDFEQSLCYPVEKGFRNRFTLIYSPPEQLLNRLHLLNPSSDISAIGILLYEMISGSAPYCDCNPEMLLHLQLTYPIKKRPTMREDFFCIIQKAAFKATFPKPPRMLDYDTIDSILMEGIKNRYQSCNEMINPLSEYLEKIKNNEPSWWHRILRRMGF